MKIAALSLFVPNELLVLLLACSGLAMIIGARKIAASPFVLTILPVILPPLLLPLVEAVPIWLSCLVLAYLALLIPFAAVSLFGAMISPVMSTGASMQMERPIGARRCRGDGHGALQGGRIPYTQLPEGHSMTDQTVRCAVLSAGLIQPACADGQKELAKRMMVCMLGSGTACDGAAPDKVFELPATTTVWHNTIADQARRELRGGISPGRGSRRVVRPALSRRSASAAGRNLPNHALQRNFTKEHWYCGSRGSGHQECHSHGRDLSYREAVGERGIPMAKKPNTGDTLSVRQPDASRSQPKRPDTDDSQRVMQRETGGLPPNAGKADAPHREAPRATSTQECVLPKAAGVSATIQDLWSCSS